MTRSEIIIKVQDGRAITVVRALDRLERELGDLFPVIFKSITCDNGSEFANWAGIERSVWKTQGTTDDGLFLPSIHRLRAGYE